MSMVTQCPYCSTAFNVTSDQLFSRDGHVRCGQCQQVFDGWAYLTSLEALRTGVAPPLATATEAAAPHSFSPENWPIPLTVVAAAEASPDSIETNSSPAMPLPTPARKVGAAWAWAAMLPALALGVQVTYVYRSEVAAYIPAVKPALAQACDWAQTLPWLQRPQCSVLPLQRPSALHILASDLLIVDKARPHEVQLIVTLQNQSSLEVAYPALDLALNDKFEHVVARRVFLPQEYLRGDDAQKKVIAASVTTTVRVNLDVSELQAGGFALLLLPVPHT